MYVVPGPVDDNYILWQNRNFCGDNDWKFRTDALLSEIPHWDRPKFRAVDLNSAFYFVTVAASYNTNTTQYFLINTTHFW